MKAWVAACLLLLSAAGGWAEAFRLPNGGTLELFPVGRWKVATEDVGEIRIILMPEDERLNARGIYSIATEGSDDFPTDEHLRVHMHRVAERLLAAGDFVERRPVVKPFFPPQGFGYYTVMTDRKLAAQRPPPGEYRFFTLGMIRLAPAVMLKVQLSADREEDESYQHLLGMAEGAVYTPPR